MFAQSRSTSPSPGPKEQHASQHNEKTVDESIVPWFPSPMDGFNEESGGFSPRHEASTIELFFDLWFVANLATFTQYHAITNRYNFWSYVAFFMILWTSWFHIVCFDARFAFDSVWERACKAVHFCAFAAFALVGYKYQPIARDPQSATPLWIYRTLCFAILLSRAWLALQYLVTTIMCTTQKHRKHRLTLPLALNTLLFFCVAAVFAGFFGGFHTVSMNITAVLIAVYVLLMIEFFGTLAISMTWRNMSFKATHIGERLGLLGLIIIGEGVIGTTKTVVRTMGSNGPTIDASAQIFCIILILIFMWILYFDKVPKYRFSAVKQQVWMALHLPFHLAILGVAEGSVQLAQARYIYYNTEIMGRQASYDCVTQHLDGQALTSALFRNVEYFKINESAQGTLALDYVWNEVYALGNLTGVCSPANTSNTGNEFLGLPYTFAQFFSRALGALFQSFDIDIPREGQIRSLNVALDSWVIVYTYFWSAILLLIVCYTITALLAETDNRGNWRSIRRYASISILSRAAMMILAAVLLAVGVTSEPNHYFIQWYIASAWILPTVVLALWVICMSDRLEQLWTKRRGRSTRYESVALADGDRHNPEDVGGVRRRTTNGYGYPSH